MTERLRFNYMNRHLGVANVKPEYLKTFYAVSLHTVQYHGGSTGYFNYECHRTDL
jgi:hypothetical protein